MPSLTDTAVLGFGLLYYLLLCIVFLLRAYERDEELRLKYVFSFQLLPFGALFVLNLIANQINRSITVIPLLVFLGYDLWYRSITMKKPVHHPEKWPKELIIYVVLLFTGSIGLNWYGFLASKQYGMILVAGFFAMIGCYSFYQNRYNRKMKQGLA